MKNDNVDCSFHDHSSKSLHDEDIKQLICKRIEVLRPRLLDLTRRNPLINVRLDGRSRTVLRVVDELPDVLRHNLSRGAAMRLVPLPSLDEDPADEDTSGFQNACIEARRTDEAYRADLDRLDSDAEDWIEREQAIERALKDRVRAALKMPPRQHKESLSLEAHARLHGVRPGFDLPYPSDDVADRHADGDVQTLLLPDQLLRLVKGIADKGRTFEQETGVGVLQAAFGLVEWAEQGAPTRHLSPLVFVPIEIHKQRSRQGTEFFVVGSDGATMNATLGEKLRFEFGIELPVYDGESIEDYMAAIAAIAPRGMTWSVRREVVIGVFPSSKLAMYEDLDTKKRDIAANEAIATLFAGSRSASRLGNDYNPDDPKIAAKVPYTVLDADASQFSALVDIADGRNLAIEGPPGTGKSQTIVNAIAAALVAGKKVLFVAEKTAALDVVKNRLEGVGLSAFLLTLQPGRGSREAVYASIAQRLEAQATSGEDVALHVKRIKALNDRRARLQAYLDTLAQPFADTDLSVHDVLGLAISTTPSLENLPAKVRNALLEGVEDFDRERLEEAGKAADDLSHRLSTTSAVPDLWQRATAAITNRLDAEDACASAEALAEEVQNLIALHDAAPLFDDPLDPAARALVEALERLVGDGAGRHDLDRVERLFDDEAVRKLRNFMGVIARLRESEADLATRLRDPGQSTVIERLREALAFARSTRRQAIDPGPLARAHREALARLEAIKAFEARLLALANRHPGVSTVRVIDLEAARNLVADTPARVLDLRSAESARPGARATIENCLADLRSLLRHRDDLQHRVRLEARISPAALDAAARSIAHAGVFAYFSSAYKAAMRLYADEVGLSKTKNKTDIAGDLHGLAVYQREIERFDNSDVYKRTLGSAFRGTNTSIDDIEALLNYYDKAAALPRRLEAQALREVLVSGDVEALLALESLHGHDPNNTLEAIQRERKALDDEERSLADQVEAVARHSRCFVALGPIAAVEIERLLNEAAAYHDARRALDAHPAAEIVGGGFRGLATDLAPLEIELEAARALRACSNARRILDTIKTAHAPMLIEAGQRLLAEGRRVRGMIDDFAARLGIDAAALLADGARGLSRDLNAAFLDPQGLIEAGQIVNAKFKLAAFGLGALADLAAAGGLKADRLAEAARAVVARAMARAVYARHGHALEGYTGQTLDRLRAEFARYDREIIELGRATIHDGLITGAKPPRGNGIGRKSDYTELALINNELSKKQRRLSLRDLTRRAGKALLELKPCWMMSPLAVAQYVHPGMTFDLVMIDEASQMTPENAVGAIYRGHQLVVVGDTKQLPPTAFFTKMFNADAAEDDIETLEESVLDMANAVFNPVRQLRWHYRSRHSDLIRFSNEKVYEGKLIVFPSACEEAADAGVRLVQVEGAYKSGTNIIEAEAIHAAILRFMKTDAGQSLGVVTMNNEQRELLLEMFERSLDADPAISAYAQRWTEERDGLESFFIKNLENIQGDERDVIFIGTVYGPERAGARVMQRFGPVNSAAGHRRLNVLFSRAKQQIVTFTSLRAHDVEVNEAKNRGVHMLRGWLEYNATGHILEGGNGGGPRRGPDSDFERFVIAQIEAMGCEAVPQVGRSGYFIDIGVRHPDWPHGFVLGVECDGASYHSSRSSRERDRLRQEVLEGLGWCFHRIWSTDWFTDPRREIERLRFAIAERVKDLQATRPAARHTCAIVVDDPAEGADHNGARPPLGFDPDANGSSSRATALVRTTMQVVKDVSPDPGSLPSAIGVGDRVTVEKLYDDRAKMVIHLEEHENAPSEGKISVGTPLGEALLEAEEGEEVEFQVGSYIRSVRVLSIDKRRAH